MSLAWSNLRLVGTEIKAIIETTEWKQLQVPLEMRPAVSSIRSMTCQQNVSIPVCYERSRLRANL